MEGRDPAGPQRDPASVQAEIEQVQARLATAIDALVDRTSPKNVARRGLDRLRDTGENLAEEARALVTGSAVLRKGSESVEPGEGDVLVRGEGEVVADYELRRPPSPAVLVGIGVGVLVAVGVVVALRRRRGR